jgi:hypothetical protein
LAADDKRAKWKIGRDVRLDVLAADDGFIVAVGPAFFLLDREAAEELVCLLADALELGDPTRVVATDSN